MENNELIERKLPAKYRMDLNRSDMIHLLSVLKDRAHISDEELVWAVDFRASILQTLGIEDA